MGRTNKILLGFLLLLFTGLVLVRHYAPKTIDWGFSFSGNRNAPYGCKITRDMLPLIFPGQEISDNTTSLYVSLYNDTTSRRNLIIINNYFDPDETEVSALLDFVSRGNCIFISALDYSGFFCDTLGFSTDRSILDTVSTRIRNEILRLSGDWYGSDTLFRFRNRMFGGEFVRYDTTRTIVLGNDRSGKVDFIMTRFGNGRIFLHSQPFAFTNYHVLYGNHRYACAVLSSLPEVSTIWDQYYKPDKVLDMSPMRYILSQPALKTAWLMLAATIAIYFLFGSKRKQRVIPVILPPRNTSMDYVATIGKLYFRIGNHTDMAKKKFLYFNEFIRNRYFTIAPSGRNEYIKALSMKSGIPEGKIKHILMVSDSMPSRQEMSSQELVELHMLLEDFYRNCK
ncbi:MAG: hypothetical protein U0X39_12790 [Bacteroidales bacterium]